MRTTTVTMMNNNLFCLCLFSLVALVLSQNSFTEYTVNRLDSVDEPNSQLRRFEHTAIRYNFRDVEDGELEDNHLLVFGGSPTVDGGYLNRLEDYRFSRNNDNANYFIVNTTGGPDLGIHSHTAINAGNNRMLVFGGENANYSAELWELNTSELPYEWQQPVTTGLLPTARSGHTAVLVGEKMFVFGGKTESSAYYGFLNDLYSYDLTTQAWTQLNPTEGPVARYGHSAVPYLNEGFYIFGGLDYQGILRNDVWYYHIANNSWVEQKINTTISFSPPPRMEHAAVMARGYRYMVVFGGIDGKDTNDIWVFDVVCRTWELKDPNGDTPSPRRSSSAIVYDDYKMIIFGGRNVQTALRGFYRYDVDEAPLYGERCPEVGVNAVRDFNAGSTITLSLFTLLSMLALSF